MIKTVTVVQSEYTCDRCGKTETVVYGDGELVVVPSPWVLAQPGSAWVAVIEASRRVGLDWNGEPKLFCEVNCFAEQVAAEIRVDFG